MTKSKSWRDVVPIHPAAELFPLMSPDELRALGEDIQKNGLTSPIAITTRKDAKGWNYQSLDGRNRLDAMELVGIPFKVARENGQCWLQSADLDQPVFPAAIIEDWNPYAYVISANIHRRHLTAEQKRDLIANLIKATPEKSDRQIAETVRASPTTVGTVRREMEGKGEVSKLDTRTDAKGVKQPATKSPAVGEQQRQARMQEQERKRERERVRREREEWRADISGFAYKLIRLDIEIARELYRVLAASGGDAAQLMDDLTAGIEIEETGEPVPPADDSFGIPPFLRRAAP
jgi:hypothetical protein